MLIFTANQLVAHAIGDYVIQSDWMANKKTQSYWVALVHAMTYSISFFFLTPEMTWKALVVIVVSHSIIDRWRLARYVCWLKNFLAPSSKNYPWNECKGTGYHEKTPAWLAVWLMIITDNLMHLFINAAALQYL